jgi:4-hydroxy-2-oxoheptanedioate aldolase
VIENKIKAMLERGERPTQVVVMSGSTLVAQYVAQSGADSVWIDLQHGPATIGSLGDLVMAVGHDNCPFVRVPSLDRRLIEKAVFDAGVHGVICPSVDTADEAAELAEACRIAADMRARRPVVTSRGSTECVAVAQIESVAGFENLEAICATPGLFGLLPGPMDLSIAFGGPAQIDYTDEAALERLRWIIEVGHGHGLYVALPAKDRAQLDAVLELGTDYTIAPGYDLTWLIQGCRASVAMVGQALAERASAGVAGPGR